MGQESSLPGVTFVGNLSPASSASPGAVSPEASRALSPSLEQCASPTQFPETPPTLPCQPARLAATPTPPQGPQAAVGQGLWVKEVSPAGSQRDTAVLACSRTGTKTNPGAEWHIVMASFSPPCTLGIATGTGEAIQS